MEGELSIKVSVAIAVVASAISLWTVWYNGRKTDYSFKIALYDRRFNLYVDYRTFLQEIVRHKQVTQELMDQFERIFDQSHFLFDRAIIDSFRVAWEQAQLFEEVTQKLTNTATDEELAELCNQQEVLNNWFIEEKNTCRERFAAVLRVDW